MARINIEEEFWIDGRFKLLLKKFNGNEFLAIGQIIMLWRIAQEAHRKGQLLNEMQFKVYEFSEHLFECGFAERRAEGIYVKGAKQHFDWLLQKRQAGKKGGLQSAKSRLKKTEPENEEKQELSSSKTKHFQPSFSHSFSHSPSFSDSDSKKERKKERVADHLSEMPAPTGKEPKSNRPWDFYKKRYLEQHGQEPPNRNAQVNKLLCVLVDRYGIEKALDLIDYYFKIPNAYYHRTFHPIPILIKDAHTIHGSMTTGKFITNTQAKHLDEEATINAQLERIKRGELR